MMLLYMLMMKMSLESLTDLEGRESESHESLIHFKEKEFLG
jgi:hypothetical protein